MAARKKPKVEVEDTAPARPKRTGISLHVWLEPALAKALEEYVQGSRPRTDKTAVTSMALEEFFASKGLWPPPSNP